MRPSPLCLWSSSRRIGRSTRAGNRSFQLFQNHLSHGVCVTKEHPRISVTADQCNLRHTQPKLKKPTDGLVSKIVEVKVGYTCSASNPPPCQSQSIYAHWENPFIGFGRGFQNGQCSRAHRDRSRMSVLGLGKEHGTVFPTHVPPFQAQDFTSPHPRLEGKQDDGEDQSIATSLSRQGEPLKFTLPQLSFSPLLWN